MGAVRITDIRSASRMRGTGRTVTATGVPSALSSRTTTVPVPLIW